MLLFLLSISGFSSRQAGSSSLKEKGVSHYLALNKIYTPQSDIVHGSHVAAGICRCPYVYVSICRCPYVCSFLRKLMVSDKEIHRAFRTHTTL